MHPPPSTNMYTHPHLCILLVLGEAAPKQDVRLRGDVIILRPLTAHVEIVLQYVQGSIILSQEEQIAVLSEMLYTSCKNHITIGKKAQQCMHTHQHPASPVPGGVLGLQTGLDEPQSTAVRVHYCVQLQMEENVLH